MAAKKVKSVQPLNRQRAVKKQTKKVHRHQSDLFLRVKPSWRRPKGIDNRVRRKFKGQLRMPQVGYGSDRRTKHVHRDGFKQILVHNVRELEMLLMENRRYAGVIARTVSSRNRKLIAERASQLGVRIVNSAAKLRADEQE